MDFYSGQDLLDLCQKEKISISSAMKQREITMAVSLPKKFRQNWRRCLPS